MWVWVWGYGRGEPQMVDGVLGKRAPPYIESIICMDLGMWRTPSILVFRFIFRLRFSTTRFDQHRITCMYGHGPPPFTITY
jgi:hypothetical protein